nr:fasciclin domain-containing protein [Actibacterium sp. 188UL27-1]
MTVLALPGFADDYAIPNPEVGGAAMPGDRNIIENAVNSADHTMLVAAVKAAGLVETLSGAGPITVFAPVNAAFDALPDGTVESLLKPANKDQLTKVLTCHVVAADAMAAATKGMIDDDGDLIMVTDEMGNVATVTIADMNQSNGVIHMINTVLLPKG